jgi:hypothetical protein
MPSWQRKLAGIGLLGLAALGLVLPLLQGMLLLAVGLFVLRDQYPWARRALSGLERRWPGAFHRAEALEARLIGWSRLQWDRLRQRLR